ncbi:MAG: hypothetical protein J6S91_11435 [Treponema sp.]|nr:hypothetical protein [Treponema sp.]
MSDDKADNIKLKKLREISGKTIALVLGIILVIAGIFLMATHSFTSEGTISVRVIVNIVLGALLLFLGLGPFSNWFLILAGLFILQLGFLLLLVDLHVIPYTMRQAWPILVSAAGISLVPAGLYRLKRMRSIYLFPAILLILLGVFFSLFSFRILHVSLSLFMHQWWPALMVVTGLVLVVLYFIQQVRKKDFPYMDDDSLMEDD